MNVECLLRDSMKTKPKSNRGARQKTSTPKNVTRMNYNENPYGMSDEVKKAVTDASLNSYMYQDFYAVDLKKQLADLYGLDRKSTRLNSSHTLASRMPSSA